MIASAVLACNRTKPWLRTEYFGMNRARQRAQSRNQRGRGSVQEFVGDAINLRIPHRGSVRPSSFGSDLCQRHSISSPAPGGDDDFRIQSSDLFGGALRARLAEEVTSGGLHQFSYPGLRCDDRLSPLFAEDALSWTGLRSGVARLRWPLCISEITFAPRSPAPTEPEIKAMSV